MNREVVHRIFTQENRRLFINPVESIPYPKKEKSPPRNILTLNEIKRLIEAPNTGILDGIRDRALLELLYSTGIRQEETVKLNTEDIDTKSGYLFVREGKGRKDRIIPVGKTAIKWLNEYIKKVRPRFTNSRKKDPALFISINGERLGTYWISTTLKEYAHQAKIKKQVTPHLIRHTMASHLLLHGAKTEIIQKILGHENLNTTTIYTRVFPVDVKRTHEKTHPSELRVAGYELKDKTRNSQLVTRN